MENFACFTPIRYPNGDWQIKKQLPKFSKVAIRDNSLFSVWGVRNEEEVLSENWRKLDWVAEQIIRGLSPVKILRTFMQKCTLRISKLYE